MENLSLRYISTLENQLIVKDDQLRRLDARLQDSFEMQRALALLVKQYEKRTGISSDLMWSELPEEELERKQEEERAAAESKEDKEVISNESVATVQLEEENISEEKEATSDQESPVPEKASVDQTTAPAQNDTTTPRSFTDWLKKR